MQICLQNFFGKRPKLQESRKLFSGLVGATESDTPWEVGLSLDKRKQYMQK